MEKKSKVTKVTKFDKKDDYGNTSFSIELENGDKGFYRCKDENQKSFVTGQEVTYLIEQQTGKNDKVYFKITLPKENKYWSGGKPQIDPKTQMISFAMAYCKDLIVGGKLEYKEMESGFEKIYSLMTSKLS